MLPSACFPLASAAQRHGVWHSRIDEINTPGYKQSVQGNLVPKPIHPFPARMAASVAWNELQGYERALTVLDPMSGSGTSLAVATSLGHHAIGVDVDPLAVLTSKVWTTFVDPKRLYRSARAALQRASRLRGVALPDEPETRAFLEYWFDDTNRRQLAALAAAIGNVADESVRDALRVAFSRMIVTKQGGVSCAMDLAHSRPHKVRDWATVRAFDVFLTKVRELSDLLPAMERRSADVRLGDARRLNHVPSHSVDRVITSPPYLNAIDYLRTSKFTLFWLGYTAPTLRAIRATSIGTEAAGLAVPEARVAKVVHEMTRGRPLAPRAERMVAQYVRDIDAVLREVARVLRRDGAALFVVGESMLRGVLIRNSHAIRALALPHGLAVESTRRRRLPPNRRYLPPPTSDARDLGKRMAYEVLLRLVPTAR